MLPRNTDKSSINLTGQKDTVLFAVKNQKLGKSETEKKESGIFFVINVDLSGISGGLNALSAATKNSIRWHISR